MNISHTYKNLNTTQPSYIFMTWYLFGLLAVTTHALHLISLWLHHHHH